MKVLCGIPQGSCLNPLNIYQSCNDFEDCLQFSSASMYADAMHETISARDTEELVQKTKIEVGNILEWMRINKMSANPKKMEHMIIGHPLRTNKITDLAKVEMNGTEIKRVHKS